jgi:hypothetical protein
MRLVIYAGAVWTHCSPTEVERFDVSSREEAIKELTSWLDWLSSQDAERIALEALEGDDYVLAGYSNELLELRSAPPEDAEVCDYSRLGDPVYESSGGYWEPFYVHAFLLDDEG